jgi:membrane protein required for colicin V production
MTIYDAAMAIVIVAGMVRGVWLGITWQLASITSLILGYVVSRQASAQFAPYFPGEPEVARALAMVTIYVIVSASVFGLARLVRGILHKLKFEAYDRHLGMLLGGMEAACAGMIVTLFVVSLAPATRQPIFSSPTGRVVGTVMNNLGPVLPEEVRKVLARHWDGESSSPVATTAEAVTESASRPDRTNRVEDTVAATSALPPLHEAPAAADQSASLPELPALPPLEAPPGNDPSVQPASGTSLDSVLQKGREEVERVVAKTLDQDPDPHQSASNLRQLVNKDRQRVKGAVNMLGKAKPKAGNQVKDRLSQGQQQIEQAITDSVSRGRQQLEQTITDSIDQELRRLGGLETAPAKGPK